MLDSNSRFFDTYIICDSFKKKNKIVSMKLYMKVYTYLEWEKKS